MYVRVGAFPCIYNCPLFIFFIIFNISRCCVPVRPYVVVFNLMLTSHRCDKCVTAVVQFSPQICFCAYLERLLRISVCCHVHLVNFCV